MPSTPAKRLEAICLLARMVGTGVISGVWLFRADELEARESSVSEKLLGPKQFRWWLLLRAGLGAVNAIVFYTALDYTTVPEADSIWYTAPMISERFPPQSFSNGTASRPHSSDLILT